MAFYSAAALSIKKKSKNQNKNRFRKKLCGGNKSLMTNHAVRFRASHNISFGFLSATISSL